MLAVVSVALSLRTRMIESAEAVAAASAAPAASSKLPLPGCSMISTPAKPTSTADQRRQRTVSPSSGTDSTVISSGVVKMNA